MVKTLLIFCFVISQIACTAINTKSSIIKVTNIVGAGNDGASSAFCADFSITKEEAQYYFDNAKQVSAKDIHDNYSFLPCFVSGEGYLNNKKCAWEVRAGGTSNIRCGEQSILMACENCLPVPE
ncbi:MAG: hypothetical protein JKY01_08020 [Pseudomonadales bacterium]|nr:hypothetical protein [Pseudomonadales bacterium]